jgi:hypothetical protein
MTAKTSESQATYFANTTVTLDIPEALYRRLQQAASVLQLSFNEVVLHALQAGSPPTWDDAPAEFQTYLAALDRLDNDALWRIVRSSRSELDLERYQELLDLNADGELTDAERRELEHLRTLADRHVLRKAHAAALLRWRGYQVPPPQLPAAQNKR